MRAVFTLLVLLAPITGSAESLEPHTLRLNSTFVVRGKDLGRPGERVELLLAGRLRTGLIEKDVSVSLSGYSTGREVRARLPKNLVYGPDAWPAGSIFDGNVKIAGRSFPVVMEVLPLDLLSILAFWFGFASEDETIPNPLILLAALLFIALFILLAVFALFAGMVTWAERRIAGRMQNRIGPNRVGPHGVLQWLADGLKCFLKEDFIPPGSLPFLFRIGPYFAMLGVVLTFVTLPFGLYLSVTDMNVAVLYILAVTGFTAVGILIGGFSSANKWSLLGAFRSAAQIVSYEIPSGLAVLTIVALAGSLSLQSIIKAQGGFPWEWNLFHDPFTFMAFFIYLFSALAEGNRTPFDLPEAESELVAGYNTEYSGMRFVFYLFAEWGNLYVMSAIATVLFLGGWQVPGFSVLEQASSLGLILAGWAILTLKTMALVFFVIWLRWTLPRVRVDQLMVTCWKYLTPLGALAFLGTATWQVFISGVIEKVVSFSMFVVGVFFVGLFLLKTFRTLKQGTLPFEPRFFI